ncbi:unnamed protein product, partial [Rotaria sp. Silwood2]
MSCFPSTLDWQSERQSYKGTAGS